MKPEPIITSEAPRPIGPYSQAIRAGQFVFVSGQAGRQADTGEMAGWSSKAQVRQALTNLAKILIAAGSSMENVVKVNVYLAHMSDFEDVNEVYREFFPENSPARTTIQAARLSKGALVEVDAIALISEQVREVGRGG